MTAKVVNLRSEQVKKRQKRGWTLAEIDAWAAREMERTKSLDADEPEGLASGGDMKEFIEGVDEDKE